MARSVVALAALMSCLSVTMAQTTDSQESSGQSQRVEITGNRASTGVPLDIDTPTTSGSRLNVSARETPASVTVVDRAQIDLRGARNTQEALQAVPGITVNDSPGSGGAVSYRGFGSSSVAQLFNGINVQYVIAARPVDSWIYERVEVLGGPSGFLFGTGGVGGAINYVTRLAEPGDRAEARLRIGTESLQSAAIDINRGLDAEAGKPAKNILRVDLHAQDKNGWTETTHSRTYQAAMSLRSELAPGLVHTLALEDQFEQVDRPYWGTPVLNPQSGELHIDPRTRFKNYNSVDGIYEQSIQWARSLTEWSISDKLQLKNTAYAYDALRDYRNVESYTFNTTNTAVKRSSALLQRHDHQMVGDRLDMTLNSMIAGMRSDWAFGLDFSVIQQTRFPLSLSSTVSTVNPYEFTTEHFFDIPGMVPGFKPDRDNRVQNLSAYVENRTVVNPEWSVLWGLQAEKIDLRLDNHRDITATSPASYERSYSPVTGRLGLVWSFAPHANAYVQYATAADPPSGILSTAAFSDVINNTDLTTGKSAEMGIKADILGGRGTMTAAAYWIERRNISMKDPEDANKVILVGRQSSRGVELALGLTPLPIWTVRGDISWVDGRYDEYYSGSVSLAGKELTGTPRVVANLWNSVALLPSVDVNVGLRYVGQRYADAANTMTWPSYTTVDLGVQWKVAPRTSLTAQVHNATDRVYAASTGTTKVYLAPGRSADLTLQFAF